MREQVRECASAQVRERERERESKCVVFHMCYVDSHNAITLASEGERESKCVVCSVCYVDSHNAITLTMHCWGVAGEGGEEVVLK